MACIAWTCLGCASAPKPATPAPPTSAAAGNNTTIVAIAPAASGPKCSLPEFLGLPQLASGVGGVLQRLGSRLMNGLDLTGRFPELQPQPPLLALSDPANLEPDAPPAVQAAAEIKAEEDAAPQKIMALRYLAGLGCGGCYEKVEEALLEGLSDCTEEVRYEAVRALQCKPECGCRFCSSPSCCSAGVRKRLEELTTCEKEPSERIRRLARISLVCCGSKPTNSEEIPREGPPEPAPELAPVAAKPSSTLFDGIQLVRFEDANISALGEGDMVLATVNGHPILESQVLPLVEERMRNTVGRNPNDSIARRKQLMLEVTRLIDWKIISLQLKNEAVLASAGNAPATPSPEEVHAWFVRNLNFSSEISQQEILAYYENNKERFRIPQRVRWERLTVKTEACSSQESALAIAEYLRNRSLQVDVVAPAEFSRDKVNIQSHDWTVLSSVKLDSERQALTQLQPGQTSNVIQSADGMYLVRLLERQAEGYQPITAVVEEIQSAILADRKRAAELQLISQLRSQCQVWTVFDTPAQLNREPDTVQKVIPASTQQR